MNQHPILFSTPMVKAILALIKLMTRRLVGLKEINKAPDDWTLNSLGEITIPSLRIDAKPKTIFGAIFRDKNLQPKIIKCPYGQPGDILWVRETWADFNGAVLYKSENKIFKGVKWKPSIHMKKDYSKIWLQIESIRVERLHDISEEDAIAEGVIKSEFGYNCYLCDTIGHNISNLCTDGFFTKASNSFMSLFESINGELNNPWVWAITFKVLSTTGKPANIQ